MKGFKVMSELRKRPMHYIIDGKIPKPVSYKDWIEWEGYLAIDKRRVKETFLDGDIRVSTVFLGLDHAYQGPPILFETMIFGGKHDGYQNRYSTYEEAEQGHEQAVNMVLNKKRK